MALSQSGIPQWGIGPSSDRSASPYSEQSNQNTYSLQSPASSSSSATARPFNPTQQTRFFSLDPLAAPFVPGAPYFPSPRSPPPPPAFAQISPFHYQQQVLDRQQGILTSIENYWQPPPQAMAPLSLPTGQPGPNAFQSNNNIHGFPTALSGLQNTSQDSVNSNDSFRTQVPLPWNLPSEYENNGAVAIPDPSPFADPPLPFAAPNFNNGQFQGFGSHNSNMNGASPGAFGQENGYQVQGQQQQQGYQQRNFGMGMNGMNGMNNVNGLNGFNGGNNAYQSSPYNGQIGAVQNSQIGNGQIGNQQPLSFNGNGAPAQSNFQLQNMGMRPQLAPIATQFPTNSYNPPFNQTYSAPPSGMHSQQFYNGGGGNNNYRGPSSNPASAPSMNPNNLNFGSLSLGMGSNGIGSNGIGPNGISPNGHQNNGYANGSNGNNGHNGMMQNHSNGGFPPAATNNNLAANARNAQYTSLPSAGNIYHPLPPKPQYHAQKPYTTQADHGHHAYAAINSYSQPAVQTPQPQKQGLQIQQGSNSTHSPMSSNEHTVSGTASEPRANFIPMLRSSHGKSITASADRAQHVNDWVQNTPTRGSSSHENSITDEGVTDRTPKMLDFVAGGAGRELIGPHESMQGGNNTFTPRPLTVNPFNPITTLQPFTPNSRFGGAGGMSPLLRELTKNGTYLPTAKEATSLRFLPFEEYCRQVKPAQWGVMRIKNVS